MPRSIPVYANDPTIVPDTAVRTSEGVAVTECAAEEGEDGRLREVAVPTSIDEGVDEIVTRAEEVTVECGEDGCFDVRGGDDTTGVEDCPEVPDGGCVDVDDCTGDELVELVVSVCGGEDGVLLGVEIVDGDDVAGVDSVDPGEEITVLELVGADDEVSGGTDEVDAVVGAVVGVGVLDGGAESDGAVLTEVEEEEDGG